MKSCSRSNGYFQRRGFVRNSNELSNELSQPFAQKNSHFTPYSGRHSLPSTSSSSAYSSDDSHEEQEIKKINVNPSGQSKTTSDGKVTKCVAANGNKLYITDETGKTKRQDIAQASSLSLQIAERIDLDHAKFGKANDRLMPWSDESSDEESKTEEDSQENGKGIRQDYARLYAKVGLPVQLDSRGQGAVIEDKAQIYSETRCAMFGCKALPTSLLTKTFKGWMETPTSMCRLIISTQDENNRRKMEEMSSVLPLFKVWSLSEHETSIYRMQDVSAYKEKCKEKDLADIYVLICEDGRMAAMGVSNFVLSVFFGGPVDDFPNNFVFPVMKSAFSEITGCNNFYEIREPQLKEAWAKQLALQMFSNIVGAEMVKTEVLPSTLNLDESKEKENDKEVKFRYKGNDFTRKRIVFEYMKHLKLLMKGNVTATNKQPKQKQINKISNAELKKILDKILEDNNIAVEVPDSPNNQSPSIPVLNGKQQNTKVANAVQDVYKNTICNDYADILGPENVLSTRKCIAKYLSNKKCRLEQIFFGTVREIVKQHKDVDPNIETVTTRKCIFEAVDSTLEQICHSDHLNKNDSKDNNNNIGDYGVDIVFKFLEKANYTAFLIEALDVGSLCTAPERVKIERMLKSERKRLEQKNPSKPVTKREKLSDILDHIEDIVTANKNQYQNFWYDDDMSCVRDIIQNASSLTTVEEKTRAEVVKAILEKLMATAKIVYEELKTQTEESLRKYNSGSPTDTRCYIDQQKKHYIVYRPGDANNPPRLCSVGNLEKIIEKANGVDNPCEQALAFHTSLAKERICDLYRILRKHAPRYALEPTFRPAFSIKRQGNTTKKSRKLLKVFFQDYLKRFGFVRMTTVDSVVWHVIKHSPNYTILFPTTDETGKLMMDLFFERVTERILKDKLYWKLAPWGDQYVVFGEKHQIIIEIKEEQVSGSGRKTHRIVMTTILGKSISP